MPARPPIRIASRPTFRPPVNHSTPPAVRPPSFRPPVHHDNPPARPPPTVTHRPIISPVVTNTIIINSMKHHHDEPMHESDDFKETATYEQSLPSPSKYCRYCSEAIMSSDICPKCTLTHEEQKYPENNNDIKDRDNDLKFLRFLASSDCNVESDMIRYQGISNRNKKNIMIILAVVVSIALMFSIPFLMPWLKIMTLNPPPIQYKHGSFQVKSLHFVDGNDGTEYAGVEYFELYITNNTDQYDSYKFITNGTGSVSQVLVAIASIPESDYYLNVILYSDGYAPYSDSWDIITDGNNWVYLYPTSN